MHSADPWAITSWWDFLSSVGTVAAALLAAAAIWQSGRANRKATDRLTWERRRDFELSVLRDLLVLVLEPNRPSWAVEIGARLDMLNELELPVLSYMVGRDPTDTYGLRMVLASKGSNSTSLAVEELQEAIVKRVRDHG